MKSAVVIAMPALLLGGCVSTVASVVTAPVRVAAKGVDWATTSQSEADRNRGRKLRKAEDRARKTCRREVDGDYEREQCVRKLLREKDF